MSENPTPNLEETAERMRAAIRRHWVLYLVEGLAFVVIGVLAIALPGLFSLAVELLLGWLLLIAGIVLGVQAITAKHGSDIAHAAISGILALVAGVLMVGYPGQGILAITVLIAIVFIVDGIFRAVVAFHLRPLKSWIWTLVSGVAGVILGIIILAGFPATAGWVLGLLFGIQMLFLGWSLVMMSLAVKSHPESPY